MRRIARILLPLPLLFLLANLAAASSISIPTQSVGIIYPPPNDPEIDHGLRILVRFEIPDSLSNKQVVYAEVGLSFPIYQFRDTTFTFEVFAITSTWEEDSVGWNFPWQNPGGDIDTALAFRRYFTLGDNETPNLDLTWLVRKWTNRDLANNGFMIAVNFVDRRGLRFNIDRLLPRIRSSLLLTIRFEEGRN